MIDVIAAVRIRGQESQMRDTYRDLSATATFNEWTGLEIVRMAPGECDLRMTWRPDEMGQYSGFLHAGLIAALLDTS